MVVPILPHATLVQVLTIVTGLSPDRPSKQGCKAEEGVCKVRAKTGNSGFSICALDSLFCPSQRSIASS